MRTPWRIILFLGYLAVVNPVFTAETGLRKPQPYKISASSPAADSRVSLSIWCEFMPYDQVMQTLPLLAQQKVSLLLHVRPEEVGHSDLARLIRCADRLGIEVEAWLLLPEEGKKLYLCEETLPQVRALALNTADWVQREKLPLRWLVFDCEPTPDLGLHLWRFARGKHGLRLASYLRSQKNREQFRTAVADLRALAHQLHEQGFLLMGATNRIMLEALRHENVTLEDCLGLPFTMIPWDRVTFLSYRYNASQKMYLAIVRRNALLAGRYFGSRAALDLGLIGDQRQLSSTRQRAKIFGEDRRILNFYNGIQNPKELSDAIEIARKAGLMHVNLYSLDGAIPSGQPLVSWLGAISPSDNLHSSPTATVKLALQSILLQAAFKIFIHQDPVLKREFPMSHHPSDLTEKN